MRWYNILILSSMLLACKTSREAVAVRHVDYTQLVAILDSFDFTISPIGIAQPDSPHTTPSRSPLQATRVYGHRIRIQQEAISAIDTTQKRQSAPVTQQKGTSHHNLLRIFSVIITMSIVATAVAVFLRKLFFNHTWCFRLVVLKISVPVSCCETPPGVFVYFLSHFVQFFFSAHKTSRLSLHIQTIFLSLQCPRISGNAEVRPPNVGRGFSSELCEAPRDIALQHSWGASFVSLSRIRILITNK